MRHRGNHRRRGFTFVEVLIANGVLLVGLVGVAAGLTSLSNLRRAHGEVQAAVSAARTQLEIVRATDFDDLLTTFGGGVSFPVDTDGDGSSDLSPATTSYGGGGGGGGGGMPGLIVVEEVAGLPASVDGQLLRAVATVNWSGVGGNQTVRLMTLLSDRG